MFCRINWDPSLNISSAGLVDLSVTQITTSKVARRGEIIQGRRNYGHDLVDYSNPPLNWGATGLAVQFWLGLLAKWWIRLDSFDCNYSSLDGTLLNELGRTSSLV
jgi:hypothetical protein